MATSSYLFQAFAVLLLITVVASLDFKERLKDLNKELSRLSDDLKSEMDQWEMKSKKTVDLASFAKAYGGNNVDNQAIQKARPENIDVDEAANSLTPGQKAKAKGFLEENNININANRIAQAKEMVKQKELPKTVDEAVNKLNPEQRAGVANFVKTNKIDPVQARNQLNLLWSLLGQDTEEYHEDKKE